MSDSAVFKSLRQPRTGRAFRLGVLGTVGRKRSEPDLVGGSNLGKFKNRSFQAVVFNAKFVTCTHLFSEPGWRVMVLRWRWPNTWRRKWSRVSSCWPHGLQKSSDALGCLALLRCFLDCLCSVQLRREFAVTLQILQKSLTCFFFGASRLFASRSSLSSLRSWRKRWIVRRTRGVAGGARLVDGRLGRVGVRGAGGVVGRLAGVGTGAGALRKRGTRGRSEMSTELDTSVFASGAVIKRGTRGVRTGVSGSSTTIWGTWGTMTMACVAGGDEGTVHATNGHVSLFRHVSGRGARGRRLTGITPRRRTGDRTLIRE